MKRNSNSAVGPAAGVALAAVVDEAVLMAVATAVV